jgi:hypothetical protein
MLNKKINGLPSPATLAAARRSEGERSEVERSGAVALPAQFYQRQRFFLALVHPRCRRTAVS